MKKIGTLRKATIVFLVILYLAVNCAVYILFDDLTRMFEGTGFVIADTVEADKAKQLGQNVADRIVGEGIVLLRNENNVLPLGKGGSVNLFGWATVSHIRGGDGKTWGLPEPDINDASLYTDEVKEEAKAFSDAALVTIARGSGECVDIPEGYLSLTQQEKDLLNHVRDNFSKVVVVINSNSVMEIGYLEDISVDAILLMPGTDSTGASALGKILCGDVNPSGRTVDTMPYDHKTIPSYYYANRPSSFAYSDQADAKYVDYVEGIYVGYKYWETAFAENTIDYDRSVQYPFGHGLSYTQFKQEVVSVKGGLSDDELEVQVKVSNTGDRAGKEVVQLYVAPPYTKGGIEKSAVDLVSFAKTGNLQPGAEETVIILVDPFEIASYDYNDANQDGKTGYILEKGTYELKLMSNAHDQIAIAKTFELSSDIVIGTILSQAPQLPTSLMRRTAVMRPHPSPISPEAISQGPSLLPIPRPGVPLSK